MAGSLLLFIILHATLDLLGSQNLLLPVKEPPPKTKTTTTAKFTA